MESWTYSECAVPTARAQSHAVGADTETADTVLVTGQHADSLTLKSIPDVARPVIVTTKENTSRNGESDGSDTAQDVVVRERVQLTVGANVEQAARGIVRARSECVAVGEEAIMQVSV